MKVSGSPVTARAVIRQADLDRALKAAAKAGYEVRIEGGAIRLLPTQPEQPLPSSEPDSDWDRRLGLR